MPRSVPITQIGTAIITMLITTPISILIGYYLSKSLAAPKLSIEYITPVVLPQPLTLDKTIVKQLILHTSGPPVFLPNQGIEQYQCAEQLRSFLSLGCAKYYQANLQDNLSILNGKYEEINRDIKAISAWDGSKPLSLPPLQLLIGSYMYLPWMPIADKERVMTVLRQNDKDYENTIQLDTALLSNVDSVLSKGSKRTGVAFNIGILNSGDFDGVIFPNATLSFLRNKQVSLVVNQLSHTDSYNVVHAHSFIELTMDVDGIKTPPEDQSSLQSAVEHESQERYHYYPLHEFITDFQGR